ncbi:MAG: hypothetical protein HFH68_15650 [Lachnospiraceae bacterium]|nr:hypothetical protein [Lachnospiraceae bacterium]
MRIKKVYTWMGRMFKKLRLLFMFHFMFDRIMREENMKWQKRREESKKD